MKQINTVLVGSCMVLLLVTTGQSLDIRLQVQNTNRTLTRLKRQNDCNGDRTKFQCSTNPDCILSDYLCDGKDDCSDGSDERQSVCSQMVCPEYLFSCDYGACVNGNSRCDGKKDCKDNSDENGCPSRFDKVNTNCRSDQFECDNGQCIETDGRCNGIAECEDKSDETERLCLNIECPGYTYKCKYGACVDGNSECDGIKNCFDNSDEENCKKETSTQSPPTGQPMGKTCLTPRQPQNGKWIYFTNENQPALANIKVPPKTQLVFSCNDKYTLSTTHKREEEIIYCRDDGQWSFTKWPTCKKLCPKLYSQSHVILECKNDGSIIPCDKAIHETVLTYKCDPYYEPVIQQPNVCSDGRWYYPDPRCDPICGEKQVSAQTLVVNGAVVKRGHYPWVVALYSNKDSSPDYTNICGGSLLSTSIVITAAHCVTYQHNGNTINTKYFQVAGGKYYNKFGDDRDQDTAQYSKIKQILKHPDYRGDVQNFANDIALLKLKTTLALSKVVQPVCLPTISLLRDNTVGLVTGWGYTTATGQPSDTLKEIELPYTDNDQCRTELDPDFADRYLISDKLCAGYVNKSMSVCRGDSGGGLVVKGANSRYFIQGLVSLAHAYMENNLRSCNIQKRALFTNINVYTDWILTKKQLLETS
ncbi:modular serine protease-like [Anthonomus grandis grandis]|uniref:modular serine protease-like n=1 Tax=Anthonomus grandis grandis TaxID=2921223 RepID=UPI002165F0B0|nr:modular serine protease-like [Anthonomus grandis grandis]